MARLARAIVPGIPCHATHRGNRRGEVFFADADRRGSLAEPGEAAVRFRLKIRELAVAERAGARAGRIHDPLPAPARPLPPGRAAR